MIRHGNVRNLRNLRNVTEFLTFLTSKSFKNARFLTFLTFLIKNFKIPGVPRTPDSILLSQACHLLSRKQTKHTRFSPRIYPSVQSRNCAFGIGCS